jgi:hypothetical protein
LICTGNHLNKSLQCEFANIFYFLSGVPLLLSACNNHVQVKDTGSAVVMKQVKNQVKAFQAADTLLNSEGVIDLL